MYTRMFEIIDGINSYKHDSLRLITKYFNPDILIVDDFLLYPINNTYAGFIYTIYFMIAIFGCFSFETTAIFGCYSFEATAIFG